MQLEEESGRGLRLPADDVPHVAFRNKRKTLVDLGLNRFVSSFPRSEPPEYPKQIGLATSQHDTGTCGPGACSPGAKSKVKTG